MRIEIKVRQKVINKEKFIEVKNIKMLSRKDLPLQYLYAEESVAKHNNHIDYFQHDRMAYDKYLCEGECYPEETFAAHLRTIKRCAKNLRKNNFILAENLEPSWNNIKKTIII